MSSSLLNYFKFQPNDLGGILMALTAKHTKFLAKGGKGLTTERTEIFTEGIAHV